MRVKKSFTEMSIWLIYSAAVLLITQTPIQAGTIIANAGTNPPIVSKGQPTEIRVEALSDKGVPIPNADVKISAGGGSFLDTHSTEVHGYTDANGIFVTPWKCLQCAPTYIFSIEVTKPGFNKWMGKAEVNIAEHPLPVQCGPINVNAGTHPPDVSKGQATEIRVEALSAQGTPIPHADVKISAGGGIFLDSNNTVVHGKTDPSGVFLTPWKCVQCAPGYEFDIEVTTPGFEKGLAKAHVNITAHPSPVPGGPINVHADTHPSTVSKGQPTEIRVEALSAQGTPIPHADVKISAGGGIFLDSKNTVVHGKTDPNGVFLTPWKCVQCAPGYEFDIEVTTPGFEKGQAKAHVNIKF